MQVSWTLASWADALDSLPTSTPLPTRVCLLPTERHAHALRRELCATGRSALLPGTHFLTPLQAATEVLLRAGTPALPHERSRRRVRLLRLFATLDGLAHFDPAQLRENPGWEDAFARALTDLEAAGLTAETLATATDPLLADLARIWRLLDASAGASWTPERVLGAAAEALARSPAHWPFPGPVLAPASSTDTVVWSRFVRAIPGVRLVLLGVQPARPRALSRVRALYGGAAETALAAPRPGPAPATSLERLARDLFSPSPQSPAPAPGQPLDETARFVTYAGVDAELEAAAQWVGEQVLSGVPLEELAVLVAGDEALLPQVADRLRRLDWPQDASPVYVCGGVPAPSTAGGARALAVVRALQTGLPLEAVAGLLPALRLSEDDPRTERQHLSRSRVLELVCALGTTGGGPGHPEGARAWAERLTARQTELAAEAREAQESGHAREAERLERQRQDLAALAPGVRALVELSETVRQGAALPTVWEALRTFLLKWMLDPTSGPRFADLLHGALAETSADPGCEVTGGTALRAIEEALVRLRVRDGRFGGPAVFVGTVAQAAGLSFRAVRVLGLAEGSLPSAVREDAVLPDRVRETLAPGLLPGREDRVHAQLQSLAQVVRDVRGSLVLSAPRVDADGTQRQPSSVFLEAASALGETRPLEDAWFGPARQEELARRRERPLTRAAWQDRAARGGGLPSSWQRPELALERFEEDHADARHGVLECSPMPPVPGLSPASPISASALSTFLRCPHQFLFERILGLREPEELPSLRRIEVLEYGTLLHAAAEDFFTAHGEAFVARERPLAHWLGLADDLCAAKFQAFLSRYPLEGESVRAAERARLTADLRAFLHYDWEQAGAGPRRFVAVEKHFDHQLVQDRLYVTGQLDRIDVEGATTVVRDLKTGSAHLRRGAETGPTPARDVQIALYGLVARELAGAWGTPEDIAAAYAYVSARDERAFRKDFDALEQAAHSWLSTTRQLLEEGLFPRTPKDEDCTWCPFRVVCPPDRCEVAARFLGTEEEGPLAEFRELKNPKAGEKR